MIQRHIEHQCRALPSRGVGGLHYGPVLRQHTVDLFIVVHPELQTLISQAGLLGLPCSDLGLIGVGLPCSA